MVSLELRQEEADWQAAENAEGVDGCPKPCSDPRITEMDGNQYPCWQVGVCADSYTACRNKAMGIIRRRATAGRCIRCGSLAVYRHFPAYCRPCFMDDIFLRSFVGWDCFYCQQGTGIAVCDLCGWVYCDRFKKCAVHDCKGRRKMAALGVMPVENNKDEMKRGFQSIPERTGREYMPPCLRPNSQAGVAYYPAN